MNSKRAKMLRKVTLNKEINTAVKGLLGKMYRFIGTNISDRQVYKYLKHIDKNLTTTQKVRFSANKVEATLSV